MSVELGVRILRPVPIEEMARRISARARELLGVDARLMVRGPDWLQTGETRPLPAELRAAVSAPRQELPSLLVTAEPDQIVGLTWYDAGFDDDPEGGTWVTLSAGIRRNEGSLLLAAATAVAISELSGGIIEDDERLFGLDRLTTAAELADQLHRSEQGKAPPQAPRRGRPGWLRPRRSTPSRPQP